MKYNKGLLEQINCEIREGNEKGALKLSKKIRFCSKGDKSVMLRGYESILHPKYYKSLGQDIGQNIGNALDVLKKIVGYDNCIEKKI